MSLPKTHAQKPHGMPCCAPKETQGSWEELTIKANSLYKEGAYHQADPFYQTALQEAFDIFQSAKMGLSDHYFDPTPLLVTSATNFAENNIQRNDKAQAYKILSWMIEQISAVLRDEAAPFYFQKDCAHHLGYAMERLRNLMTHLGTPEKMIIQEMQFAKEAYLMHIGRRQRVH